MSLMRSDQRCPSSSCSVAKEVEDQGRVGREMLQANDRDTLRTIIYEYAKKVRERKLFWRKQKLIENDKKKEAWKRE
eukprot:1945199-Amphidinium_carterae.1